MAPSSYCSIVILFLIILFVLLICTTAHKDGRKHIEDYNLRWIRPFSYRNIFNSNFICSPHVSNETITDKCSLHDFKNAVTKLTSTYTNEAY